MPIAPVSCTPWTSSASISAMMSKSPATTCASATFGRSLISSTTFSLVPAPVMMVVYARIMQPCIRETATNPLPCLRPPVGGRQQHEHRDDLQTTDPHQHDHQELRRGREGQVVVHRSDELEPRTDVAERRGHRAHRLEQVERRSAGAFGVEEHEERRDEEDDDVQQGEDVDAPESALVQRPSAEPHRSDRLGVDRGEQLALE